MPPFFVRSVYGSVKLFSFLVLLLLSACSTLKPIATTDKESICRYLFSDFEEEVISAGRLDGQDARVSDYPYLRVNRFLYSYRDELHSNTEFDQWATQMMGLAQEAYRYEWKNLPSEVKISLQQKHDITGSFNEKLAECGDLLWQVDRDEAKVVLPSRVDVPKEYRTSWRWFGLYPVTSRFVSSRVRKLHQELKQSFLLPVNGLPVKGELRRYALADSDNPISAQAAAKILKQASANPLAISLPKQEKLNLLLSRYAPIWEVDQVTDDDRIGQPYWTDEKYPRVDLSKPALYSYITHARFDGQVLLQLNYTIWFPARPLTGMFDLFGGRFDGITWRVTLDQDGQPLMYDTMHNCGCYHQWFPSDRLVLREEEAMAELEPPLVITAPVLNRGERMALRINSREHFLVNIYSASSLNTDIVLEMIPYNRLRSLGGEEGARRSLFDSNGIVPGSQRAERWLLWPMGVLAPGAMRQKGRHVIVFAGERYFDEAHLIEQFFKRASSGP